MSETETGIRYAIQDRRVLEQLRAALLEVDSCVIWECYKNGKWGNPDADIFNMIGNIEGFLKENAESLPDSDGIWWCTSHRRQATKTDAKGRWCCDPKLGGILLSCNVVFYTQDNTPKEVCPKPLQIVKGQS